jgi:glycosyltransferase involved in cell wall biosynthesis
MRRWSASSLEVGPDRSPGGVRRHGRVTVRVAMLAPISWRVPPRHYGPWEQFVSLLTEGLVARGIDVTLFATADSSTGARLSATVARGWSEDPDGPDPEVPDPKVSECLHISAVFERAGEFDLIHNSFDFLPLTYSALVSTPVLTTIHGFSSPKILPVYEKYNRHGAYVAISDADRHPRLDYLATIHHGIDTDAFALGKGDGGYLLFFGRIHPEKGTVEAIEVARRLGVPLVMAGIVQDQRYFEAEVVPRIDGDRVRYLGPVGPDRRPEVLGRALALLHLIGFDEPFGFSVVEAMTCGTPVVAFRRGSMPELVEDGGNGALVDDLDEATAAVPAVVRIDRAAIRAGAVARFGRDRMTDDYVAAYSRVLAGAR